MTRWLPVFILLASTSAFAKDVQNATDPIILDHVYLDDHGNVVHIQTKEDDPRKVPPQITVTTKAPGNLAATNPPSQQDIDRALSSYKRTTK